MPPPSETIALDVLNCTDGDTKLTFDTSSPIEVDKARRVITDMLRRGYSIFVEVEGTTKRVMEFDAARGEYLVSWGPEDPAEAPADSAIPTPRGRRRVKAAGSSATSVALTAGG